MTEEPTDYIREFADRGVLWLLESPENLRAFVAILAAEIAERLDFTRAERVNRSFVPDDLHKQEADMLYRVPYREGSGEVWIYILLEHQSRPDRAMGLRLLSYMVHLWEAQRRAWEDARVPASQWRLHPVLPIVFYTGKRRWKTPLDLTALMDVPSALTDFVPRHKTLFLSLREMPASELTATGSAVAWALRALQAAEEPLETLSAVLAEVVANLEKLPDAAQSEWRRAMYYLFLLIRHKREAGEQEPLYQVVTDAVEDRHKEEIGGVNMTGAQALILEGRREMLLEQMAFKFGTLSRETVAKVNALSDSEITELAKRVLDARSLADLEL